jgi:nitrogen fixation protein FixH
MKPGMGWPLGITAILGATIAANLVVMRIANDDPSFAVEPDYYRKAVQYDSTMAQQRENLSLGWGIVTALDPIGDGTRTRLVVQLLDASRSPLPGAQVAVMARFNARANDTLTAVLAEHAPGTYVTNLPIARPGEWEVRVDAAHGSQHFSASTRVTAVRAVAANTGAPAGSPP